MWLRAVTSLPRSVYIHIPFCRRRCYYCDFAVLPVGHSTREVSQRLWEQLQKLSAQGRSQHTLTAPSTSSDRTLDRVYVDAVISEVSQTLERLPDRPSSLPELDTIYIGGGTPSLLHVDELARLLSVLPRSGYTEVTMELDPGTFDAVRLHQYRDLGITRVSVGVQALSDEVLRACGRSHTVRDIERALDDLHRCGFGDAYSLDLICGLPNLSPGAWSETLARIGTWKPPHVSIYDLSIESGTRFAAWLRDGLLQLPLEDEAAEMLREAMITLRETYGFDHYEVSNYAREPALRSRHNQIYWRGGEYFGFGLSASSYVHGKRFDRHRQLKEYLEWVYSRCLPFDEVAGDTLDEWLMLRLRTQEGLSLDALQERFGAQTVDRLRIAAEPFCRSRHLAFRDDAHGISLYATDPDGWLILSHIVLELLVALEGFQDRSPARPNGNIAGGNEDALKPVLLYETSSTRAQAPNS